MQEHECTAKTEGEPRLKSSLHDADCVAMSLRSRGTPSRGSARSSQSSGQSQSGSPLPAILPNSSPSPKPPTAQYRSPSSMLMNDNSPTRGKVEFDKQLKKLVTRVCHTSGGSVRSEFEQRLFHEMATFASTGASQCFVVSCCHDENLTGASHKQGSFNGLCMIHEYYSARQNIAETGNGGEFTFAEIMAANATMSVAEFAKVRELSA